jgi:uncharacterized protein
MDPRNNQFEQEQEFERPSGDAAAFSFGANRQEVDERGLATFISQVYLWMFSGLLLTAGVAFTILQSPTLFEALRPFFWPLVIGEFVVVLALVARVHAMSTMAATSLFFLYAAVNGITLSFLLAMYTATSAATVFMVAAGTFGIMAFYGLTTKKDLTKWSSLLFMGVVGILLAMFMNIIFIQSGPMSLIISCVAVFIFVGLIAYDNQMIKATYVSGMESTGEGAKYAILAAFHLYLDFIVLYTHLLNLMGDRD